MLYSLLVFMVCLSILLAYSCLNMMKQRDMLTLKLIGLNREYRSCINKKSDIIKKYNALVKLYNQLTSIQKTSSFTQDELKRLKHYIHPDKHNGKTNDLFIKINSMEK